MKDSEKELAGGWEENLEGGYMEAGLGGKDSSLGNEREGTQAGGD